MSTKKGSRKINYFRLIKAVLVLIWTYLRQIYTFLRVYPKALEYKRARSVRIERLANPTQIKPNKKHYHKSSALNSQSIKN